jgi:pimeloyl-ACP methyl ester carboxylesterase
MNNDGSGPLGGLVFVNNTLFGTANLGGLNGFGTFFSINTNGTGFTNLYNFTAQSDGAGPVGELSVGGTLLYGATTGGGIGSGVVYSIKTNGTGVTGLHTFAGGANDGESPGAGVTFSSNTLYGTTTIQGSGSSGIIYAVTISPKGFKDIYNFSALNFNTGSNSDGSFPACSLVLSNGLLYGSAEDGGNVDRGTIYSFGTNGLGFNTLYSFTGGSDGQSPSGSLVLSSNVLYGTAEVGGSNGNGSVYGIILPSPLSATISAAPARVQISNTIQVVVTVENNETTSVTGVQLNGPITVAGNGGVVPAGTLGPTNAATLAPKASVSFTNLFTATNYGTVTFSASATASASGGLLTSPSTSASVSIFLEGDLLIKLDSEPDNLYAGANLYLPVADPRETRTNAVGTNQPAAFDIEVVNNNNEPTIFNILAIPSALAGWSMSVQLNGNDVTAAIQTGEGLTLPELDPGNALDLVATITPTNAAPGAVDSVQFSLGVPTDPTLTVDVVTAVALEAAIPMTMSLHELQINAVTPASLDAGLNNINAPLQPVADPNVLILQPIILGGLVADEVTPLVIQVSANPNDLASFPSGRVFTANVNLTAGGTLNGPALSNTLQVLDPTVGNWATNNSFTLTQAQPTAYLCVGPFASDNVQLTAGQQELAATLQIVDQVSTETDGSVSFGIRKPPIFLIHGYNTTGDWGEAFQAILGATRPRDNEFSPNNFVVTVKYGQDIVPGYAANLIGLPVYQNTSLSLEDCAVLASNSFAAAKSLILQGWAMTRFDVMAHSQGGVLSRMLASQNPNAKITAPYVNPDNFNRGRFHRVVTVGSPQNGTRLLRYLLTASANPGYNFLAQNSLGQAVPQFAVGIAAAQEKFDPFGPQIQNINNPAASAPWYPDARAPFHIVRTVIDDGLSPGFTDVTPGYIVLGLANPAGGSAVIPRGSDGVVDYDSMGVNVPPAPLAANVYDVPPANDIAHASASVFLASASQTESTVVAQHAIDALDQNGNEPSANTQFGPFQVPPLLPLSVEQAIDNWAIEHINVGAGFIKALLAPQPFGNYTFTANFGSNQPQGNVCWQAQVYGPQGITTNGLSLAVSGANDSQLTLTVGNSVVGDVVLSAFYASGSNVVVIANPVVVVSIPPSGVSQIGLGLVPGDVSLPVGSSVPIEVVALYSDGSSAVRFVTNGALTSVSSAPEIVSVTNALDWQLLSPGTAQVVSTWSGFSTTNEITVFVSPSSLASLSITNNAAGTFALSWPSWATNYVLQTVTNLSLTNWQTVTSTLATNQYSLTNLATGTSGFYRLEAVGQ